MNELVLNHNDGQIKLGPKTLLFAIDETGHENFNDPNYPFFGFGGCGVLVQDYLRLIEKPWTFMCKQFFSEFERPLHAADLRNPTNKQIESLNHFFTKFEFFRVATLAAKNAINIKKYSSIKILSHALLERLYDVGQWAEFDRIFIIFEESERIEIKIIQSLANKKISRKGHEISIELGLMPKSSCNPALEIADFIIHTAGRQVRHRNTKDNNFLPDFSAVFKTVDSRLQSFMEITKVSLK